MAVTNADGIRTFTATAAITAGLAVKYDTTANYVALTAATTDKIAGIAVTSAAAGAPVSVKLLAGGPGTHKVTLYTSTTCSYGSSLFLCATSGKFFTTSTGAAATSYFTALEAGTAAGTVEAYFYPIGQTT